MMDICKNCGDKTNLKLATGPRQHLGWCVPCFKQAKVAEREETQKQFGHDPAGIHDKRPYDSR